MRLCKHPDFEQAIIRAEEHFSAQRLNPRKVAGRMDMLFYITISLDTT
jgi:hypothetical protein